MKRLRDLAWIGAIVLILTGLQPAARDDITLEGELVCASCRLKEEGRSGCQIVLMVPDRDGPDRYYLSKNDVYLDFGEV